MKADTECSFFMGSNSPEGFCSLFNGLYDAADGWTAYILKGGPGSGKSSMMKRIAAKADEEGLFCERIYCASDEKSLDAVIIPSLKKTVADGTSPHVVEPRYPGACEVLINPGDSWDIAKLRKNSKDIISLTQEISNEHAKSTRFLVSAGGLLEDSRDIELENVDFDRLFNFAKRLARREFGDKRRDRQGKIARRFLSAPTPSGLCIHYGTIECLCERVIEINDSVGACSGILVEMLSQEACERGFDSYLCLCPLSSGKISEHLIIPALSLCFFTSKDWHPAPEKTEKSISLSRFTDIQEIKKHSPRLEFNQAASGELITEAMKHSSKAKELHDLLEAYYIAASDFSKVEAMCDRLIKDIFS